MPPAADLSGNGHELYHTGASVNDDLLCPAAGNCPGPLVAVTAVVNAVTADPVTQDGSRCGDGSLTLTATDTASCALVCNRKVVAVYWLRATHSSRPP